MGLCQPSILSFPLLCVSQSSSCILISSKGSLCPSVMDTCRSPCFLDTWFWFVIASIFDFAFHNYRENFLSKEPSIRIRIQAPGSKKWQQWVLLSHPKWKYSHSFQVLKSSSTWPRLHCIEISTSDTRAGLYSLCDVTLLHPNCYSNALRSVLSHSCVLCGSNFLLLKMPCNSRSNVIAIRVRKKWLHILWWKTSSGPCAMKRSQMSTQAHACTMHMLWLTAYFLLPGSPHLQLGKCVINLPLQSQAWVSPRSSELIYIFNCLWLLAVSDTSGPCDSHLLVLIPLYNHSLWMD